MSVNLPTHPPYTHTEGDERAHAHLTEGHICIPNQKANTFTCKSEPFEACSAEKWLIGTSCVH